MHVGTNNFKHDKPKVIKKKIVKLVEEIKQEVPNVKVAISSVTKGADDPSLSVSKVNGCLKSCCESKGLDFICNDNVDQTCKCLTNLKNYLSYRN